jgi:cation diffusion facilitator family transporter
VTAKSKSSRVVYAAVFANVAIAIAKFIVAAITGSSAVLSEGIHSTVDSLNECLLLLGLRRSRRSPDQGHPFGHGKELYFWSLLVAVLLFGVGGGMAIYEGIIHIIHGESASDPLWSCAVLAIAACFEGYSFAVAFRALGAHHDAGNPLRWWKRVQSSKDPAIYTVFVEDFAALCGIIVALAGVGLGVLFDNPYFDGAASILIGCILATVAVLLAHETRELLVGESARPEIVAEIRALIERDPDVDSVEPPLTMQLGRDAILVNADVHLRRGLSGEDQVQVLERIVREIRTTRPQVSCISLQPK